MKMKRLLALAVLLASCDEEVVDEPDLGIETAFTLRGDRAEEIVFGDIPFPNDLFRKPDGAPDLSTFPNGNGSLTVREILGIISRDLASGWGISSATYFFFEAPLDPATLPSPAATLGADSPVWIVNVDPASPARGERLPAELRFVADAKHGMPANTLAVLPVGGHPLREATRYAVVVTRDLRGADGRPVKPSLDLVRVLCAKGAPGAPCEKPSDPTLGRAHALYAPVGDELERIGLARGRVAGLAVLTTRPIVSRVVAIRDALARLPAPAVELAVSNSTPSWFPYYYPDNFNQTYAQCARYYDGSFRAPTWLSGQSPWTDPGAGVLQMGADGLPESHTDDRVRFLLVLPNTAPPAGGYPVILYGHGSGGDRCSVANGGGIQCPLAAAGYALIGFDFPTWGERSTPPYGCNDPPPETLDLGFNPANPVGARNGPYQAASDLMALARAVRGSTWPAPAVLSRDRVFYVSQSMGGFLGPAAIAASDDFQAAAMNGAGGGNLLYFSVANEHVNANPDSGRDAMRTVIEWAFGIPAAEQDRFQPLLNLAQMFLDPTDALSFARAMALAPPAGVRGKHLLFMEGTHDHYVAAQSTEPWPSPRARWPWATRWSSRARCGRCTIRSGCSRWACTWARRPRAGIATAPPGPRSRCTSTRAATTSCSTRAAARRCRSRSSSTAPARPRTARRPRCPSGRPPARSAGARREESP